ncbi:uncharacterized protein DSM5745_10240 [Aspergillus mulundensis]|uniref:NAD(P)-binding protein n=1 Tax=Aspergillus mulundensis TaxID=1810919 RepID=A0A3D8QMW1_9EURO|nr:hypothetical protein DSM5745_10240 [Aspergillus mulundensis]RDW63129.1 hypothetical protein DSM5745_10240 [Aspergillus mulundensis]
MPFYNSQVHFLHRQFFLTPSTPPPSFTLTGKSGLITGANTSLGYHAASHLLSLGVSRLILAVRSLAKGEAAKTQLLNALPGALKQPQPQPQPPTIEVWELDLASYPSIIAFVERLKTNTHGGLGLDFAILNAGAANFAFTTCPSTGNEESIQLNWLGTALLTLLLLPVLDERAAAAKSAGHDHDASPVLTILAARNQTTLLETLNAQSTFVSADRYATSKLLQQLFFVELVRRRAAAPWSTGLNDDVPGVVGRVFEAVKRVVGRPVAVGARTLVHAAVLAGIGSDGGILVTTAAGYGESPAGMGVRRRVWEEMIGELGGMVDGKVVVM